MVETILSDNYVADILACGNTGVADDTATTEGKSVSSEGLRSEFSWLPPENLIQGQSAESWPQR